jgi:plasmid stabilization system protein ParE
MAHRVAPRAEADLEDIWLYVAKESGSMGVATSDSPPHFLKKAAENLIN